MKKMLSGLAVLTVTVAMLMASVSCSSAPPIDKEDSTTTSSALSTSSSTTLSTSKTRFTTVTTSSGKEHSDPAAFTTEPDAFTTDDTFPPIQTPTPSELSTEYSQFMALIHQLDEAKASFSKIDLSCVKMLSDGGTEEYTLSSSDTATISEWINLLNDMTITAVPFNGVCGMGYGLSFCSDKEELNIGGFTGNYIYLNISHGRKVMMKIDNYEELRPRFEKLEKGMGFPASA